MRVCCIMALLLLATGCKDQPPLPRAIPAPANQAPPVDPVSLEDRSDLNKVRSSDISILFVGNSHTGAQDLPDLVCKLIRFGHPEKQVYSHTVFVSFLENVAHDPRCIQEIESRPWKYVVLQAQKISRSGRHEYSQKEGIDIAKLAKVRGASVLFFAEWGLKDVADNGPRHEKIYQDMARASGGQVAPIGRAWDLALVERPDLRLHAEDGNHQSQLGAFLTGCVLFGSLTGESPLVLASFPYPETDEKDRKFLANAAAKALTTESSIGKDTVMPPRVP